MNAPASSIDAHHHLWRVSRGDYWFLGRGMDAIARDRLLDDLRRAIHGKGIAGTIVVQSVGNEAEVGFLLELADQSAGLVRGVVGWVDLFSRHVAEDLERFRADRHFKGVRLHPSRDGRRYGVDMSAPDWPLHPDLKGGFEALAAQGVPFDALIKDRAVLAGFCALAERLPALRIVIEHAGRPPVGKPMDSWRDDMRRIARQTHAFVKLSGLASHASREWTAGDFLPYFEHLLAEFGSERIMWGSDWPTLEMNGTYDRWWNATRELVDGLSERDRINIMGASARNFYDIRDAAADDASP